MNLEQRLEMHMENPKGRKKTGLRSWVGKNMKHIVAWDLSHRLRKKVCKVKIERVKFDGFTDEQREEIKGIVLEGFCWPGYKTYKKTPLSFSDEDFRIQGDEMAKLHCQIEKTYLDLLDTWADNRGIKTRVDALRALILLADK